MERMTSLTVTIVRNPFDPLGPGGRDIRRLPWQGHALGQMLADIGEAPPAGYEMVCSLDGRLLDAPLWADAVPAPGSSLVLCAVPQGGGGGKNPLRTIAMLAVVIVATYVSYGTLGPYMAGVMNVTSATGIAAVSAGVAGVMNIAGGLIVSALFPVSPLDATGGLLTGDFSGSPTYGWNAEGNAVAEGSPWPVLYGTYRVTPPLIGKYIEIVGDSQYLNLLYAVADHHLDAMSGVILNGNDLAGYQGVNWETRFGDDDQSVIQYFNDTRTMKTVGVLLTTSWHTVQTDGNAVAGISVGISFPNGLGWMNDTGGLDALTAKLDIEYRLLPAGAWTRLNVVNVTSVTVPVARWSAGYWYMNGDWCEVEVGSAVPADHLEGDPYAGNQAPIIIYEVDPPIRQACLWRWVPNAATVQQPGTVVLDYVEQIAAMTSPIRRVWFMDGLAAGSYEVRCRLHEALPSGARYLAAVWFDYIEEIVYDDFSYPGAALLAVRALATEQISGGLPTVELTAQRATVPVWTGAAYEDKPADNPAWICYDILHDGRYGGGVPYSRIDYAAFADWAAWCDTEVLACHIYFDAAVSLRKALDTVSALGRASVVQMGSVFTCIVDREETLPVQRFLFTGGNILKDTFQEEFLAQDDRANAIEVTWFDAGAGYERQTLELYADVPDTPDVIKTTQITLLGCTSQDQAVRHGRFLLNCNRYLTLTASWEADVDALACLPGDVVEVAHDVPQWGYGGRIVSALGAAVVLDRDVTLSPGETYTITVKLADDTRQERTCAAVAEETVTDTLTLTEAWDPDPAPFDLYAFGRVDLAVKAMRVLRISRAGDFRRRVTAIEYNASVYDDSGTVPAPPAVSDLAWTAHLRAIEVWKGGAETRASLSWTGFAASWHVWMSREDGAWTYMGQTSRPAYEISGLDYGPAYDFCVSHTRNTADGITVALVLTGKTTPPGDVGAVSAVPWEDGCTFTWAKVTDFDLAGYQARSGISWQADTLYAEAGFFVVPTDGTARRYRCTTPGISGATEPAWPVSGSVSDGAAIWVEDSTGWAWQDLADTVFSRELTAAEKAHQGKGALTIRIWVLGVDAFGNVSTTAATATGTCLNQKPYLSVGVTTVEGTFTDLAAAIDRLPSGGGAVGIKNGTYQLSGAITLPDKNLDIFGESKKGVVLRNDNGYSAFAMTSVNSRIALSNFTIESQNNGSTSAMLSITNTPVELYLTDLDLFLAGGGYYSASGDTGLFSTGHGTLHVKRCSSSGGSHALYVAPASQPAVYPVVIIEDILIDGNSFEGIFLRYCQASCRYNRLTNQAYKGFYIDTCDRSELIGNAVTSRTDQCGTFIGIEARWFGTHIENNTIVIKHGSDEPAFGIACTYWDAYPDHHVVGNRIEIDVGSTLGAIGIHGQAFAERNLSNNALRLRNTAGSIVGIQLEAILTSKSIKNGVNINSIHFSGGVGYNTGIYLTPGAEYNTGSGNIIVGADTDILDLGILNDINTVYALNDIDGGEW